MADNPCKNGHDWQDGGVVSKGTDKDGNALVADYKYCSRCPATQQGATRKA